MTDKPRHKSNFLQDEAEVDEDDELPHASDDEDKPLMLEADDDDDGSDDEHEAMDGAVESDELVQRGK